MANTTVTMYTVNVVALHVVEAELINGYMRKTCSLENC